MANKYYKIEIYLWARDAWITEGGIYTSKKQAMKLKNQIERKDPSVSCSVIEKEFDSMEKNFSVLLSKVGVC